MIPHRFLAFSFVCAVAFGSARLAPALAEVAADSDESGRAKVVIVLLGITEDGEPVPNWTEQGGETPQRRVLNGGGAAGGDGPPSIVVHPHSGIPIVAWSRNSDAGRDIVVSRFESGAWTPTEVVVDEPADALDPHLVADATSGEVHLLYWIDGEAPGVMHRSAPADLSSWSAATAVSLPLEIAARPSAVVHGGRLLVTYESHPGGLGTMPRQIVVAEHVDGAWVSEVVAASTFTGTNAPQIHGRPGRVWIDWFDDDDVMRWSSRRDGASWTSLRSEPFTGGEDREFHVRGRVRAAVRTLDED